MNITDIVVDINDFAIVANMIQGVVFLAKNGGMNLMLKQALMDEKYLIRRFFDMIRGVESVTKYTNEYDYDGVIIPPILMDYLLDNDTDENILSKIVEHLENTSSWMEKKGWIAVAEMTFNSSMSTTYRIWNAENLRMLEQLSKHYTIHMLGNCNRRSLDNMIDINDNIKDHITGHIVTSSDIRDFKCSQSGHHAMFEKFLEVTKLNKDKVLFIEVHPGYIEALNNLDPTIKTILYRGKDNKKDFIEELNRYLGIDIDYNYIKGKSNISNGSNGSNIKFRREKKQKSQKR